MRNLHADWTRALPSDVGVLIQVIADTVPLELVLKKNPTYAGVSMRTGS